MTSYPNSGARPDPIGGGVEDFGRSAPVEQLTPDEGVVSMSTEEPGAHDEAAGSSRNRIHVAPSGSARSDPTDGPTSESKAAVAKSEAADMKDTALDAGTNVVSTARQEAGQVAQEARAQARGLLDQLRSDVREQGSGQKDRIASTLHSLSAELGSMASKSEEEGPVTDLAHQASRKGGEIAHWLENHEPGDVLDEVKGFARRRPFTFLALCAAAGIVAGRLTRGAVAANTSLDSSDASSTNRALTGSGGYRSEIDTAAPPTNASPGESVGRLPVSTGRLDGDGDGYQAGASASVSDGTYLGQGEYRS